MSSPSHAPLSPSGVRGRLARKGTRCANYTFNITVSRHAAVLSAAPAVVAVLPVVAASATVVVVVARAAVAARPAAAVLLRLLVVEVHVVVVLVLAALVVSGVVSTPARTRSAHAAGSAGSALGVRAAGRRVVVVGGETCVVGAGGSGSQARLVVLKRESLNV